MSEQRFPTPGPVRLEITVSAGRIDVASVEAGESSVVLEGSSKLLEATNVELLGDRLVVSQRARFRGALRPRRGLAAAAGERAARQQRRDHHGCGGYLARRRLRRSAGDERLGRAACARRSSTVTPRSRR